jgi:hypothetical protein
MSGSYQSPKVIQIYAQQCFANASAMPVDTWINTFLKWPLAVFPKVRSAKPYSEIFTFARNLGKVERLLWVAAQARKVHSSACNDALWCVKRASAASTPRGANPLACNICLPAIRVVCPAFQLIRNRTVQFNQGYGSKDFVITTSAGNSTTPAQEFVNCHGPSIYQTLLDDFSPKDNPSGFAQYPQHPHMGTSMSVHEFVEQY